MARVDPVYEEMPGWTGATSGARTVSDLPMDAHRYVEEIERRIGVPITMVSVGPERDSAIKRAA